MDIKERISELRKNKEEFLTLSSTWDPIRMTFSKNIETWNALQIMEHLMTSEFGTLAYMKKKTKADASEIPVATEENKFNSSKLNKALLSEKKWKAPEVMPVPLGEKTRDELIEFWAGTTDRLEKFVLELPEEYHDKQIFKHPYAGRLNLDQTLEFLTNHITHHKHQMKRLRSSMIQR